MSFLMNTIVEKVKFSRFILIASIDSYMLQVPYSLLNFRLPRPEQTESAVSDSSRLFNAKLQPISLGVHL